MKHAICQQCLGKFILGYKTQKFCSLSCGNIFRAKINLSNAITKYHLNPTMCQYCNSPITYEKRKNKYCSHSCAATFNNLNASPDRKRGPTKSPKFLFSTIQFLFCKHTNQYYSNRNSDGSLRRGSPYIKSIKEKYYMSARFKFNVYHYPEEFNLSLVDEHGWYSCPGLKRKGKPKNTSGVSRDHIMSVSYGFSNNIDPKIISHPANCRIMLHSDNKIKHDKCDLTIKQLLEKIDIWDKKYNSKS